MHPLQTLIEDAGFDTYAYSGRAMYGLKCLAVNLDDGMGPFVANLIDQAVASFSDDAATIAEATQAISKLKTDSMGLGIVVYFPGVPHEGDASETKDA